MELYEKAVGADGASTCKLVGKSPLAEGTRQMLFLKPACSASPTAGKWSSSVPRYARRTGIGETPPATHSTRAHRSAANCLTASLKLATVADRNHRQKTRGRRPRDRPPWIPKENPLTFGKSVFLRPWFFSIGPCLLALSASGATARARRGHRAARRSSARGRR